MEREEITKEEISTIMKNTFKALVEKKIDSISYYFSTVGSDKINDFASEFPSLSFAVKEKTVIVSRKEI